MSMFGPAEKALKAMTACHCKNARGVPKHSHVSCFIPPPYRGCLQLLIPWPKPKLNGKYE